MSEPFIGEIRMFAGNFALSQNTALFSLLGTTYGGDGRTTFALPDLRGRVSLHAGNGPGLSNYPLGQRGGVEQVALSIEQMPNHSHALVATNASADELTPANHTLAIPEETPVYSASEPNVVMAKNAIAPTGSSQPHENRPPYLTVNYIIALFGIFPARS